MSNESTDEISSWFPNRLNFFNIILDDEVSKSDLTQEFEVVLQQCYLEDLSLAFLVLSNGHEVQRMIGISNQESAQDSYKRFFRISMQLQPMPMEKVRKRINDKAGNIAVVQGPNRSSRATKNYRILLPKTLTLNGGMLTLALPIPRNFVEQEITETETNLRAAAVGHPSPTSHEWKSRMGELKDQLESGEQFELWQTSTYIFSSNKTDFEQLKAIFTKIGEALKEGVDRHLVSQFAMPTTQAPQTRDLQGFKYLRPLTTKELTDLVALA